MELRLVIYHSLPTYTLPFSIGILEHYSCRTMITITFPPSPALSACDSLDGIEDLDAFLAAQGPLSQFATPPLKDSVAVEVEEVLKDDAESETCEDDLDCVCFLRHEYYAQRSLTAARSPCCRTIRLRDWRQRMHALSGRCNYQRYTIPSRFASRASGLILHYPEPLQHAATL